MEEIHLFIIWSKGIGQKDKILKDISENFTICSIYNTTWSENRFSNNLSRFYGENLPKNSNKEKHCGTDTFCCIIVKDNNPIVNKLNEYYFVHSYYFDSFDKKHEVGVTNYGINFASIVSKENIYGVQFHPEKSSAQ